MSGLADLVDEAARRHRVPGVAVGVWQEGREEYAYVGVTSVENPLPVDAETRFQIGSTTKTFTATALAILAWRGELDWEAPVRRYLPELRLRDERAADSVTVRQLTNHTAGWDGDLFLDTGAGDDALARYVAAMADLGQLLPPGRAASYNNAAVSLAGRVVERVTGRVFEEAVEDLVLRPLGLEESEIRPLDVMTRRFAVGHAVEADEAPRVMRRWPVPRSAAAAGGIAATARDQLRYARFHLGHGASAVLPSDARRALQEPTADFHHSAIADAVGTGWLLHTVDGTRLVGHGGSTNGQRSAFQMVPSHDFALVVLTNASSGAALDRELLDRLLGERLGLVRAPARVQVLAEDQLLDYAGVYANANDRFTVRVADDLLSVQPEATALGAERMRAFAGELPPSPAFEIGLTGDDRYLVLTGASAGARSAFLREPSDAVWALDVGGRLALRES